MTARAIALRTASLLGAAIGYGCLAAFLYLISMQLYRWFRQGEWTHIGMIEALRSAVDHCCVQGGSGGRAAAFLQWLDFPADWLGMHKVLEAVPASLALFVASIAGNCIYIYCRDRLQESAVSMADAAPRP
jgi:hypothetical protein